MSRYIDATDIAKQIADFKKIVNSPNSDYMTGYLCALSITEGMIANTPTADVVEVRHGHWVRDSHREEAYCSLCDGITPVDCEKQLFYESDYCPNCGAKMDGERKEK